MDYSPLLTPLQYAGRGDRTTQRAGWQDGQKWVERCAITMRAMGVAQRGQGSPVRRKT